jgi:hypothetical protein
MSGVAEIESLLDTYRRWLKEKTSLREIEDWVEITTPFLDRHNDSLQIYARRENGGFILTDDSYIIHDLEASGCNLRTDKRKDLLNMTLNGFGVKLRDNDALEVYASPENFARHKHTLIQAMLAVNDMFYLAKPVVESLFFEDVVAWLDENEIRYTPKVKFTGTSAYDHLFDFVIPKSRREPERILKAINRPTRQAATTFSFEWTDTRDVRSDGSKAYALLNDADGVPGDVIEALRNYQIKPVVWSQKLEVLEELAA